MNKQVWTRMSFLSSIILSLASNAYGRIQKLGPYTTELYEYKFTQPEGMPFIILVDDHYFYGCAPDVLYKQTRIKDDTFFLEFTEPPQHYKNCKEGTEKNLHVGGVLGYESHEKAPRGQDKILNLIIKNSSNRDLSNMVFAIDVDAGHTVDFKELGPRLHKQVKLMDSNGLDFQLGVAVIWDQSGNCHELAMRSHKLDFVYGLGGEVFEREEYYIEIETGKKLATCHTREFLGTIDVPAMTYPSYRKVSYYWPEDIGSTGDIDITF